MGRCGGLRGGGPAVDAPRSDRRGGLRGNGGRVVADPRSGRREGLRGGGGAGGRRPEVGPSRALPGLAATRVRHDVRGPWGRRPGLGGSPDVAEGGRRRAVELDRGPRLRMAEAEPRGVEAQAVQGIPPRAVAAVADHRVAELRHLDPDLVAAARAEAEADARHVRAPLEDAVAGDRDAGAPAARRGAAGVDRADAERALLDEDVLERALVPRHRALDDRDVPPLGGAGGELELEAPLGVRGLGDDQEARGLAVQPVDDERPAGRPRALEVGPHQAIGRPLPLVLGADREEPGRLLDDQERRVLVDQPQERGHGRRRRRPERHRVPLGHHRARIPHDLPRHPHPPRHEPRAQAPARRIRKLRTQPLE